MAERDDRIARDRILSVLHGHEAGRIRFTFPSGGGNLRIDFASFQQVATAITNNHVHVDATNPPSAVGPPPIPPGHQHH